MFGIFARGRVAWIAGIVLGVGLIVAGIATSNVALSVGGGVIALLSLAFLILSYTTRGATD